MSDKNAIRKIWDLIEKNKEAFRISYETSPAYDKTKIAKAKIKRRRKRT